jgi:hypothetical protein
MIVACKLPNGLDIGGAAVLRGSMIGHEDHQRANAPGRERVAGYEITRDVDAAVWARWLRDNRNSPIVGNHLVHGCADYDELVNWCWAHTAVRGWMKASQE